MLRYGLSGAAILMLNFFLPRLMPGDPLVHLIGVEDYFRYPELVARLQVKYGLDQPLHRQFARYLGNVAKGDLGYSFRYRRPVGEIVLQRLKWTLLLVVPALGLGGGLAAFLGPVAGWHQGRVWERCLTLLVLFCKSLPTYGVAMLALVFLAFKLELFPLGGVTSGRQGMNGLLEILWHASLPILILSLFNTAQYFLILRNTISGLKNSPFIAAARARGLSERRVLFRHAFPHALPPFLTLVGLGLGFSVAGAMLVEVVFSWPGTGTLIVSAVNSRDYPLLQGCFLVLTLSVLAANFATDAIYGICDPRVRQES